MALSFPSLPMVCFAPVMLVAPVVRSMSLIVIQHSSCGRCPRSLLIDSLTAISSRQWSMRKFTSSSFGARRFLS